MADELDVWHNQPVNITFMKVLRIAGIILAVIAILYIGLVIYRIPAIGEEERSKAAVARIEAQRITLADVMGERLPSTPDASMVDATVEGVDANGNGIRDDVELAIFAEHPDSARLRAAKLQYAKALQMYLTEVFNFETWKVATQMEGRGFGCIYDTFGDPGYKQAQIQVEDLMFNSNIRTDRKNKLAELTGSFRVLPQPDCMVDIDSLEN